MQTRPRKRRAKTRRGSLQKGRAPGTPVFIGERKQDKVRIDVIDYDEATFDEQRDVSVEECERRIHSPSVTWINFNGIHEVEIINRLGALLSLHPLTLEDIVDTDHRPKAEEFPNYLFCVLKMMSFNEAVNEVEIEHVSFILGDNWMISFLEDEGDVFDAVRERIRSAKGRIRSRGADYLAHALMDAVVDDYFLAVERIGDQIEDIDDRIVENPQPEDMQEIHRLKRDIVNLRKAVWPLREEIGALEKFESALIRSETKVFLRDLYDHTIQVIDMVETYRDILGGIHDTYLSGISNRMNETMKVLTVIGTLFIPLTFIVGVYGMNFKYMPELEWKWGYFLVWGVMIAIGSGMLLYFKRKRWM